VANYISVQSGEWNESATWGTGGGGLDAYTVLLLDFEDDPFTDASDGGHTINETGDVTRSSTQEQFGTYSAYFDGSSHLEVPVHADWNFGNDDFTIDMWIYPTNLAAGSQVLYSQGENYNDLFNMFINSNGSIQGGREKPSGNYPVYFSTSSAGLVSQDAWNHIALVRYGNDWRIYVDGVSATSDTVDYDYGVIGSNAQIGTEFHGAFRYYGYIDEFRISKGVARWQTGFSPPSAAYGPEDYPKSAGDTATLTHTVTYSISADVELGEIDIDSGGTLSFNPSADTLMAFGNSYIQINDGGTLSIGTSALPINKNYTCKLSWDPITDGGTCGIYGHDGYTLWIYGDPDYYGQDEETYTAYDCTGSTSITATDDMSSKWNVGDEIVIYKNDLGWVWNTCMTYTTITGFDGNIIQCSDAISSEHLAGGVVCNLNRNVMLYKYGYDGSVGAQNTLRPNIRSDSSAASPPVVISDCSIAGFYRVYQMTNDGDPASRYVRTVYRNGYYYTGYPYFASFEGGVVTSCRNLIERNAYHVLIDNIKVVGVQAHVTYLTSNIHWQNCYLAGITSPAFSCNRHYFDNCTIATSWNIAQGLWDSEWRNCYIINSSYGLNNAATIKLVNCEFGWDMFGNSRPNTYDLGYANVYCTHLNSRVPDGGWGFRDRTSVYNAGWHRMENEDGVAETHVIYDNQSTVTKVDADGSGSHPTQRAGGNATVWYQVALSQLGRKIGAPYDVGRFTTRVIDGQQIYAQADLQRTIRYYIQSSYDTTLDSDMMVLTAEYVNSGDTTVDTIVSTETIAPRSNQSDWSQYVEVTINPTYDCWVRLYLDVGPLYVSGKYVWVDPKPEVV
jgi:hypothetical protein